MTRGGPTESPPHSCLLAALAGRQEGDGGATVCQSDRAPTHEQRCFLRVDLKVESGKGKWVVCVYCPRVTATPSAQQGVRARTPSLIRASGPVGRELSPSS